MTNTVSKTISDATLSRIIQIESAGKPRAKAGTSSASGLGQFINATWLGVVKKHRPDLMEGRTKDEVLALRFDPKTAVELLARFTEDNAKALGAGWTEGDLYLAHFAGIGTAKKLLRADADAPVSSIMSGAAIEANRSILAGKTAGQVRAWASSKMAKAGSRDWVAIHYGGEKSSRKAAPPVVATAPAPVAAERPGIWTTLWRALRGKDAKIATKPEASRPGLAENGDVTLYDQQAMLSDKGFTEVGQPDGLMDRRTKNAIRAFRAENRLAPGESIDGKFAAALLAAGPRQIAQARVETKADDLREKGNPQVATLDSLGWLGKILIGTGLSAGVEQSGILGTATETLQTAQGTLQSVATVFTTVIGIAQWCFSHWWLFAIGGGLYVLFKVASGVLNVVVLFRQGFLARADR